MNCEQVRKSLVFYLDGEISPEDARSIRAHLAGCDACRRELDELALTRKTASQTLQRLAAGSEPSPLAWSRLQATLNAGRDAHPPAYEPNVRSSRLAPGVSRTKEHRSIGANLMRKRIVLPALMAVVAIAVVAVFAANSVTPVSAQQVLERATTAQNAVGSMQGIHHLKVETYSNMQALTGEAAGVTRISDSYTDLQTGMLRSVVTDAVSGKVVDAFAYDGSYSYSHREDQLGADPVTLYRVPQKNVETDAQLTAGDPTAAAKAFFTQFTQDGGQKNVHTETWTDGRKVYTVEGPSKIKVVTEEMSNLPTGTMKMVFDAQTYQILEYQSALEKDGKEIVVNRFKMLVNETLPVDTKIAWNLSDVSGIAIVEDPNGEHGDVLPEKVTAEQLASQTQIYTLSKTPDGFTQEITSAPNQPKDQPLTYVISYRNAGGDYFVIQSNSAPASVMEMYNEEPFQTASGLKVSFAGNERSAGGKTYTSAAVTLPDGTTLLINSTLSRDEVKKWVEDLVPAVG